MKGSPASSLIVACYIGRVALALDADLAQEAVSKLQQYIQLRTSSKSAAPEELTPDELDAAARMYALEVCDILTSSNLHVISLTGHSCSALSSNDSQVYARHVGFTWRLHASQTPWDQLQAGHLPACVQPAWWP